MKHRDLVKQLEIIQKKKTLLKQQHQQCFDLIHEIEIGIQLILEELYKEKKK